MEKLDDIAYSHFCEYMKKRFNYSKKTLISKNLFCEDHYKYNSFKLHYEYAEQMLRFEKILKIKENINVERNKNI